MERPGRWVLIAKRADFNAIARKYKISPVLARLMVNRDIRDDASIRKYLYGTIGDLYSPLSMKDIFKGAQIIEKYVRENRPVAIASDFDVDGIFSSYILYRAFERIGGRPEIFTPDRVKEGYGLNERIVNEAYEKGAGLIVTCDNGIAAFDAIKAAKTLGMSVIVTDHHDIPYEEDENGNRKMLRSMADAIINPKQEDCAYPFKKLCGAGVAFKLVQVLYDRFGIPDEELFGLIQYVAVATVADVMDLEDENRIFVKYGLRQLSHTDNPGLRALIQVNSLSPDRISAYHIGFVIGPCFNAAGRLDTVKIALDLLLCKDEQRAIHLAMELKAMNESRKEMTAEGFRQAVDIIENSDIQNDKIMLVLLENCHESIVGIIAGRIKEKYNQPVIVFTKVGNGNIKGSARSIEAYNMFEGLMKCRDLLDKFGGHPMAAGMTLKEKNLEPLRRKLNADTTLTERDLMPVVKVDVPMPIGYISFDLIDELELLEPFGKGNTKPVFAEKYFHILRARVVGKNQNVLKMSVCNDDHTMMEAMYFGDVEAFDRFVSEIYGEEERKKMYTGQGSRVELAMTYYPSVNEYMGTKKLQIVVTGYCKIPR